ncbi:MDR family MFS transporter [Rathayibacter soli]|uniref:MDR family MFS transporter n=1 Tax=Rathayibacter soli TaxID=3144168 RepID=UPI0027E55CAE|nr:MDR family MFS transporter [Glaciibacter superstes]
MSSSTRTGVGLRSERGPLLTALMLATALVALDSTIIATAVPSVVKDLGGFSQFPWLFSIYLLAQAVTVPLYGRFADIFGRKPVMLFGIAVFLLGSVLSGLAWSMPVLILFRAIQGIGAGAVAPMSMTIAGDVYTVAERAKVQGYLAAVWGLASVIGPAIGGIFSDYLSWRWIFYVNVPICLLAGFMIWRTFHERAAKQEQKIDYPGAVLLTGGTTLLILGLLEGGVSWAWGSVWGVGIFVLAAALLVAFVVVETRVKHPILPLWVFSRRVLLTSTLASAVVGAIVIGLSSYLPTFAQVVLGTSALVAGFALAFLTLGWPITAALAGRFYLRIGFRATALIGTAFVLAGSILMLMLGTRSQVWEIALFCAIIGAGMGPVATPTLIAAQASVDWDVRGVVTGNNMFARSVGSAVGVAVFGAIVNASAGGAAGTPSVVDLVAGTHLVFLAIVALAIGMLVAVSFMPGRAALAGLTQPAETESGQKTTTSAEAVPLAD